MNVSDHPLDPSSGAPFDGRQPGWYPWPEGDNTIRWWNGTAWTDCYAVPARVPAQPHVFTHPTARAVVLAIVAGLTMAVVGGGLLLFAVANGGAGLAEVTIDQFVATVAVMAFGTAIVTFLMLRFGK